MTDSVDKKQVKADEKAEKARAKAMRPWLKNKRFILPLGLVALVILVSIVNGGESGSSPEPAATTQSEEETAVVSEDVAEQVLEDSEAEAPSDETTGERNARLSAEDYLAYTAFSRSGLIDQLVFEGYSNAEAEYAVDAVNADWMEQAVLSALDYLDYSAFSESGLADQLEFEGYTPEEAAYGVANSGADWMEQAAKSAEAYLEYSSFSRSGLIDQLVFEGFTQEQAEYGVSQNGY